MFGRSSSGRWFCRLGIAVCSAIVLSPNCALGQIIPDGTLPNNTIVTPDASTFNITGGTQAGGNLFHSFKDFSVPTGGTAFFNNGTDIANIISRVTGGSISNINGLIRSNGTANLFLLNPSGIVFGLNASLNVSGSFLATTANAIQFGERGFFSASNPETPTQLLAINPSALLFNQITAPIRNQSIARAGRDPAGFNAFGLRVPDGKSLLLVGGNVSMDGGQLNAYGGRVELGGLAESGTVALSVDGNNLVALGFPAQSTRADVSLTNRAGVYVEAAGGGSIAVNARNIEILGGSQLTAGIGRGLGSVGAIAGDITLNATNATKIEQSSGIINFVNTNSTGNGGNINIKTGSLSVTNGAQLVATTRGKGDAGSVIVNTSGSVSFDGTRRDGRFGSAAFSIVEETGFGKGGDIKISADSVSVTNGAQLSVSTSGKGDAGNVIIDARGKVFFDRSGAFSDVDETGVGKSGNIKISADSVSVTNGAQLSVGTSGKGDAGNVIIDARGKVFFDRSGAFSDVDETGVGKGGNIKISADSVSVTNRGQLSASTSGTGDAGNVIIDARGNIFFDRSAAFSYVEETGVGKGGDIKISADSVSVSNGARLNANTFGKGDAGSVIIDARGNISLNGTGSYAVSTVEQTGVGKGGDIKISADSVFVTNLAAFAASTLGKGDAGNIIIDARGQVSFVNGGAESKVSPTGVGKGGDIKISADSVFVANGAILDAATLGKGNAGSVIIDARGQVSFDGRTSDSKFATTVASDVIGAGKGGNIKISADSVSVTNGAQLVAITRGQGDAGSVIIDARGSVSFDNSKAFSQVEQTGIGKGGDIKISADSVSVTKGAQLSASTLGNGNAGSIIIDARGRVSFDGAISRGRFPSAAYSIVGQTGSGKGGDVRIIADSVSVTNGAQLSASTFGKGDAASVIIDARGSVSFDGASSDGSLPSAAFSIVEQNAEGNGKNITISADSLFLTNGAQLQAETEGKGVAGNIQINAKNFVSVSGTSSISGRSSGLLTFTTPNSTGKGGDIIVDTPALHVSDGAVLDARTNNSRNGGNITVNVRQAEIMNGGQLLSTSSSSGNAGKITLNATDQVIVNGSDRTYYDRVARFGTAAPINPNSGLFVLSQGSGIAGDIEVRSPQIRLDNTGTINATSTSGNGGNINLQVSDLLLLRRGSQISATAGTARQGGDGGNININSKYIIAIPEENSDITANAFQGRGGNVQINSQGIFGIESRPRQTEKSDITASSELGVAGNINLIAPDNSAIVNSLGELPQNPIDTNALIANSCIARTGRLESTFTITGSGGLPHSPGNPSISLYSTGDVRQVISNTSTSWKKGDPIIEPTGVYRLPDGRLVMSRECL